MKKKGFTLIELLAVIVILAIIALIATPAVLNIIEDSRKGAAEASARNIVSAAKTYYMSETMNGRTPGSIDLSTDTLKYDGDQASKGNVTFDDGKASGKMYINGYCVEVALDGKVTSEKKAEDECIVENRPVGPTVYTKYNDGYPLLYDPINNVKCVESEVETNVNNYKATHTYKDYKNNEYPAMTGLKEGCMKWYAFLDSSDSETVNLILDHDIAKTAWNSSNGTTPDTVNEQLQIEVSGWNGEAKNTARLISAREVNMIVPTSNDFTWVESDYMTQYYLHTGNDDQYKGTIGSNKYSWLFDNTRGCETYGCNISDESYGYWTSTFASDKHSWIVNNMGALSPNLAVYPDNGIRPVITVDKSIFE